MYSHANKPLNISVHIVIVCVLANRFTTNCSNNTSWSVYYIISIPSASMQKDDTKKNDTKKLYKEK